MVECVEPAPDDDGPLPSLQGLWRREGRSVTGEPVGEVSSVVWAQVGPWFADVRQPRPGAPRLTHLDEAQAFSGAVRCSGGTVTWTHDLDSLRRRPGHEDSALVEIDGDRMVERGSGYEEVWRRDGWMGPTAVLERRDAGGALVARLVTVGDVSVVAWSGRRAGGAVLACAGEGWEVESHVGAAAIPWAAVIAARSGRVPTGWTVVDQPGNRVEV